MMFDQFPPNSRYHGLPTRMHTTADGRVIVYLARRFVPPPDRFSLLQEHAVAEGDRLDNVTARYLGGGELFWRVADANNAMRPSDLTTEIGRRLRITLPEGIPAPASDD